MQEVTAVNLNTDGASPGGADTTTRDKVEYDFTDNKARQTWSMPHRTS